MAEKIFVTAVGTDSGKTLVSSVLTIFLDADYWKPVQSGLPRDTETVQALCSKEGRTFFPEKYLLSQPLSPHAAAKIDGIEIKINSVKLPESKKNLVIEGAGGVLVPLNDEETIADLMLHLQTPVVLVSNLYLGSINHTLLTFNELTRRNIPIKGLVFNGEQNAESERIILKKTGLRCILRIPRLEKTDRATIEALADKVEW
jgi:dethiobiotin synthetase